MAQHSFAPLDQFDRAILDILQRDNRTPQREIGEAVALSAPAVQRRIRRMEEAGVIAANVALVDPASVGRPITILVELEVESERPERIAALKQRLSVAPEVQQCYYVTGEADFVVVLTVATMSEYEALTSSLLLADDNVKRFRTLVVMDRVKTRMAVPTLAE
ncbi:AsnC family transcriptional regulator [Aliidongia dinghuensis]|uniref:AsnC family transcriptional regulator n=1 Tax=Aliidongia dinghuensis TaxID=1867774 RepID=A0A8J2YRX7_9PROT|nr:Lrp/AsnC family transcriptional regulator [Aliidongia dinghuensis]GGF06604.1 AsnC family transcriptional regulator [Aliidongia dinghuensis]